MSAAFVRPFDARLIAADPEIAREREAKKRAEHYARLAYEEARKSYASKPCLALRAACLAAYGRWVGNGKA